MPCPQCRQPSIVVDSRSSGDQIRRRRECTQCKHRWSTYEISEEHHNQMSGLWRARKITERALASALEALREGR